MSDTRKELARQVDASLDGLDSPIDLAAFYAAMITNRLRARKA